MLIMSITCWLFVDQRVLSVNFYRSFRYYQQIPFLLVNKFATIAPQLFSAVSCPTDYSFKVIFMFGCDADNVLDTQGLYCPEPVMLLHSKIRDIAVGETLQVLATDPSTVRDIPKFCMFLGHELIEQDQKQDIYTYFIRKGVES